MSWVLIALGASIFYKYPTYGVVVAFIPFAVAAYLRGTHDRTLTEKLFRNSLWKLFALVYYAVLLILALLYASYVYSISNVWSALLIFLPFLVGMVVNDLLYCSGKAKPE
jgi:biotin transporter BioY